MFYLNFDTYLCPITLVADEKSLLEVRLNSDFSTPNNPNDICGKAERYINSLLGGDRPEVDFSLSPQGTPFQKVVWSLLLEIPYGQVTSYGRLARAVANKLGKDKMSAQAIGGAVGKNPLPIIIPCHRVIGSRGELVGFSGGLDKKITLLNLEDYDKTKFFEF